MTTDNQNTLIKNISTTAEFSDKSSRTLDQKFSTTIEERKGNAVKPLSLRPNRSVKKNLSLKPLGLRSR
jgi:hypothetical protein